MKNNKIILILLVVVSVRIILELQELPKENISQTFIKIENTSDFNKQIALNKINVSQDKITYINNQNYSEDSEIIYTNNNIVVLYAEDNIVNVELIQNSNKRYSLIGGDTLTTYKNNEIKQILFGEELNFMSTSTIMSDNIELNNLTGINKISEQKYKSIIHSVLLGDTSNDNKYFENGVLTDDIKAYFENNILDESRLRIFVGSTSANELYPNRICILGITSDSSVDVDIKIILKLNKIQKIYDIDIY